MKNVYIYSSVYNKENKMAKLYDGIELVENSEIKNIKIENVSEVPATSGAYHGRIVYNTTDKTILIGEGGTWGTLPIHVPYDIVYYSPNNLDLNSILLEFISVRNFTIDLSASNATSSSIISISVSAAIDDIQQFTINFAGGNTGSFSSNNPIVVQAGKKFTLKLSSKGTDIERLSIVLKGFEN